MDVKEIIETVFAGLFLLIACGGCIWFFASYLKNDLQRCKKVDEARIKFYNSVSSYLDNKDHGDL